MASLTMLEKKKLEDLLGMASGYVLEFSNSSFADLFRTTVGIDIYDAKYAADGTSKAKRLRVFWDREQDKTVSKVLGELLQFWRYFKESKGEQAAGRQIEECEAIVHRLGGTPPAKRTPEESFLRLKFEAVDINALDVEPQLIPIIARRLDEATRCRDSKASLSTIFMCGSILEALLLGAASKNPKAFNQAAASPKVDGKVKPFHDWKLGEFIDVACEVGRISLDVKKFSHGLRDFRNYIHPYEQLTSRFEPDEHTADICLQVLKAAMARLAGKVE